MRQDRLFCLSFLIIVLVCVTTIRSQIESCKLPNNEDGRCVLFYDCPGASAAINKNERPHICGFNGRVPIICCQVSLKLTVGAKSIQRCNETYFKHYKPENYLAAIGGVQSLAKEFPHMAVLGYGEQSNKIWACGGALISENFILTAAHCLISKDIGQVRYVRLGDLNLKDENDDAEPQDFNVIRMYRHPDYKPPSQYHDIALLQLERPVKISPYVEIACLQTTRKIKQDGSGVIATGWGHLSFGGQAADHLQKVYLSEVEINSCRQYYNTTSRGLKDGIVDDWQICAGGKKRDTCQGDSGGPLQVRKVDSWVGHTIIGVTSFGKACGITPSPGVYTRVSNYISWIESIVWPD